MCLIFASRASLFITLWLPKAHKLGTMPPMPHRAAAAAKSLPKRQKMLSLAQIAAKLRAPRAKKAVYADYNRLRQNYILKTATQHFKLQENDPAPLFGKALLDVGCGESTIAEFLALSGAEITAIDADASVLKQAVQSAESFGAPISFVRGKVENLLKSNQRFHLILALDILEDTPNPGKLIWVLKQLLAPGGLIIFSHISRTPRAWFYHIFLSGRVYGRTPAGSRAFSRFHTPAQLEHLCHAAGLQLSRLQGLRFSFTRQFWKFSSRRVTRYMATATAA
jgi:2-polyprenyl-6-hydroxyphenyl methylase/3-demethylubiquinone-9 3-methyltransferase